MRHKKRGNYHQALNEGIPIRSSNFSFIINRLALSSAFASFPSLVSSFVASFVISFFSSAFVSVPSVHSLDGTVFGY